MEPPDEAFDMRYKTHEIAPLGSRSDGRDALPLHFIRAVIILLKKHMRVMRSGGPRAHLIDAL